MAKLTFRKESIRRASDQSHGHDHGEPLLPSAIEAGEIQHEDHGRPADHE